MTIRVMAGLAAVVMSCAFLATIETMGLTNGPSWLVLYGANMACALTIITVVVLCLKALDGMWPWQA